MSQQNGLDNDPDLIDCLLERQDQLVQLANGLHKRKMTQEAETAHHCEVMVAEIVTMLQKMYLRQWCADSDKLVNQLAKMNGKLKKSIDDVQRKIETAQVFTGALSKVDQMIANGLALFGV